MLFFCAFFRWSIQILCMRYTLEAIRENNEKNEWKMQFFHEISNFQAFEQKKLQICTYNLIGFQELFRMPFSEIQNFY